MVLIVDNRVTHEPFLIIWLGICVLIATAFLYPPLAVRWGKGPWGDLWIKDQQCSATQRENERLIAVCTKYEHMLDDAGIRR
jgi:hypothetical protein